jgi:hypothetical protein
MFQSAVAGRKLPSIFADIDAGDQFNQPLLGVNFPASLQALTFEVYFDQPLQGVNFPASLQTFPCESCLTNNL